MLLGLLLYWATRAASSCPLRETVKAATAAGRGGGRRPRARSCTRPPRRPSGSGVTTFTVCVAAAAGGAGRPRRAASRRASTRRRRARRARVQRDHDTHAANVPSPPRTAVSGTSNPNARTLSGGFHGRSRSGCRWRSRITATCAIVNDSIAPNEYIVARKSVLPGQHREHGDAGERDDRDVRRVEARVDLPEPLGQLAVLAHREGEPRDPDQPGVGRDDEDHRRQHADVVAQDVREAPAEPEVLDDPEHGVVGELGAEDGGVVAGGVLASPASPRARRSGSARRAPRTASTVKPDAARDRPRGVAAPPRTCSRSSRSPCRRSSRPRSRARSRPSVGATPRWTLLTRMSGLSTSAIPMPDQDDLGARGRRSRGSRLSRDDSWVPLMFSAASSRDQDDPADHVARARAPSGGQKTLR